MISTFALRFTPMTDLEQCVSAARLLDANQPGLSERSLIYLGRNPHNMGVIYLFLRHLPRGRSAGRGSASLRGAGLQPAVHGRPALRAAFAGVWAARRRRRGRCCVCHLPAFLYCTSELYTDVFSLAFSPMILLAYFKGAGRGKPAGAGRVTPCCSR